METSQDHGINPGSFTQLERMINLNAAMQIAGVSHPIFHKLIKDGAIRRHIVGRRPRFFPSELLADLRKL